MKTRNKLAGPNKITYLKVFSTLLISLGQTIIKIKFDHLFFVLRLCQKYALSLNIKDKNIRS